MEISDERKEEILTKIFTTPGWVRTSRDLMKYIFHLHYRMHQNQEYQSESSKFKKEKDMTIDDEIELNKILREYNHVYENIDPKEFEDCISNFLSKENQ